MIITIDGSAGSGKSTVAAQLSTALGALQIRSDVERKRLFELGSTADSGSSLGQGIYTDEATLATYRRLREIAAEVMDADFTVIVDATLLTESRRQPLLELESVHPCKRIIIECEVPEVELRRRIVARKHDASEADLTVLGHQLQIREPLSARERELAAVVTIGEAGLDAPKVDEIRNLLFS